MKTIILSTFITFIFSISSLAVSPEGQLANDIMTQATAAARSGSTPAEAYETYCNFLSQKTNLKELTSSVTGVRFHKKKGTQIKCKNACIWEAADDSQKAQLVRGFHSVLATLVHQTVADKLKTETYEVEANQSSRLLYNSAIPVNLSGGTSIKFIITNINQTLQNDTKDFYKNFYEEGPYKNYPEKVFLYDIEFLGASLRDIFKNNYSSEWDSLEEALPSKKVDSIIGFMNEDILQVDGQTYLCPVAP